MKINNKQARKFSLKKTIPIIIIFISIIILIICTIEFINYFKDYKNTNNQKKEIDSSTNINETNDENTEIIESDVDKNNPYWDFIKMKLIDVDLTSLKQTNPDTVGWIQVMNTNINYPFVQTTDNDYYLNHSFYKKNNSAGWIFLDYRNNINNLDKNTIIYGHGRWDKTMFGTLKNILTNGWLNNKKNYVIRMSTESENTMWQVFSVYKIPTTNFFVS